MTDDPGAVAVAMPVAPGDLYVRGNHATLADAGSATPMLVSYPKSGRTWLRYMLHLAGFEIAVTHAGMGSAGRDFFRDYRGVRQSRVTGRLPIFLHRNPIDTVVSLYFQVQRKDLARARAQHPLRFALARWRGRLPPTDLEAFVRDARFGVETACRYNRAWIDFLTPLEPTMVLSYEWLRANPAQGLEVLLDYIGHEPSKTVAQIVEQSAFEAMQRNERSGKLAGVAGMGVADANDPESGKVRRGEVKGYGRYLAPATIEELRAVAARHGFEA
jgi:hypothetical protein